MDGCPYDAEQVGRCAGCPGDCWDDEVIKVERAMHEEPLYEDFAHRDALGK